jgi:hypothetical protein
MLKPPPSYTNVVTNISPLIELLEQIAKQQYEIKSLVDNLFIFQPKSSDSYRTITKALAEKRGNFTLTN